MLILIDISKYAFMYFLICIFLDIVSVQEENEL